MKLTAIVASAALLGASLTGTVKADEPLPPSGLVVLDQTGSGSLSMVGNAEVEVPTRAVYVNSSHRQAVSTTGTAILDAPYLYVVGGVQFKGQSHCTGEIVTSVAPYQDPCSGTINPSTVGMENRGGGSYGGTTTLQPGYYPNGISMNNGNVTLSPGLYVVGGQGFKVNGGNLTGEGVCIIVQSGEFNLGGNGQVRLSPMTGGPYANMVIFQPPSNTNQMTLRGGSDLKITGTIYVPRATLQMVGNSTAEGQGPLMGDMVVAHRVDMRGTSLIRIGRPGAPAVKLPVMPVYD